MRPQLVRVTDLESGDEFLLNPEQIVFIRKNIGRPDYAPYTIRMTQLHIINVDKETGDSLAKAYEHRISR